MYLVTIEQKILDDGLMASPAIEKLQAFSYQLRSEEWSVIDCIPEKGAHFELHLGGYSPFDGKDLSEADCNAVEVVAAALVGCSEMALRFAKDLLCSIESGSTLEIAFNSGHGTILYIKGIKSPDNF